MSLDTMNTHEHCSNRGMLAGLKFDEVIRYACDRPSKCGEFITIRSKSSPVDAPSYEVGLNSLEAWRHRSSAFTHLVAGWSAAAIGALESAIEPSPQRRESWDDCLPA